MYNEQLLESRHVRVFISSTFRDMHAEREELTKNIFPQLRKMCEERGVEWSEVDLRWGITDELAAEGEVLPICLSEIDHCRPFLIGILGDRYGWVPTEISPELINEYPWLKDYQGSSITEIEIVHGVLNHMESAKANSFFYFRAPQELSNLSEEQMEKSVEYQSKLAELKNRIRQEGLKVYENYNSVEEMGQEVLNQFSKVIDEIFPKELKQSPLEKERIEHEIFARTRSRFYINNNPENFETINDYIAQKDGNPLIILGESGSGKTSLLANWYLENKSRFQSQNSSTCLITHFIGATPHSADWTNIVRRIMSELISLFGIEQQIPDQPEQLREEFSNLLHKVPKTGKVILLLDALNQLEEKDQALDLVWLPKNIPNNIKLILSTLPGKPLDELMKRNWKLIRVHTLEVEDRKKLIISYLQHYSKNLGENVIDFIASKEITANPLYLRTLLEEMRLHGNHDTLKEKISHYLTASNIKDLYRLVIRRLEDDFDKKRDGLTRDVLSYLWASRRGLSQTELQELLGEGDEKLPLAYLSPLLLNTEQSLVNRSGTIHFFHDYFRQAVESAYLNTEEKKEQVHMALADYFGKYEDTQLRKLDELPWHLARAKNWDELYSQLTRFSFITNLWEKDSYEVKYYWTKIAEYSAFRDLHQEEKMDLVNGFSALLKCPESYETNHIWIIAQLLEDGNPAKALELQRYLSIYFKDQNNLVWFQKTLGKQAQLYSVLSDYITSLQLLKEQEEICRKINQLDSLQECLCEQAKIYLIQGRADDALVILQETVEICQQLQSNLAFEKVYGLLGEAWQLKGDYQKASDYHLRQKNIAQQTGNRLGFANALGYEGFLAKQRGNFDEAMGIFQEQEKVYQELGNENLLQQTLESKAEILMMQGNLSDAMALLREQQRVCTKLNQKDGLQRSLGKQAYILKVQGKSERAMEFLEEQEKICHELNNQIGLQQCLLTQASMKKDPLESLDLYSQSEEICRKIGYQIGLQTVLSYQASTYTKLNQFELAFEKLQEQGAICSQLNYIVGLQSFLMNSGIRFNKLSRQELDKAESYEKNIAEIIDDLKQGDGSKEKTYSTNVEDVIQKKLGESSQLLIIDNVHFYQEQKQVLADLITFLEEQEQVALDTINVNSLIAVCVYKAAVFRYHALLLFKEVEKLLDEKRLKNGLQFCLSNLAKIYFEEGDYEIALKFFEEQEKIAMELNNKKAIVNSRNHQWTIKKLLRRNDVQKKYKLLSLLQRKTTEVEAEVQKDDEQNEYQSIKNEDSLQVPEFNLSYLQKSLIYFTGVYGVSDLWSLREKIKEDTLVFQGGEEEKVILLREILPIIDNLSSLGILNLHKVEYKTPKQSPILSFKLTKIGQSIFKGLTGNPAVNQEQDILLKTYHSLETGYMAKFLERPFERLEYDICSKFSYSPFLKENMAELLNCDLMISKNERRYQVLLFSGSCSEDEVFHKLDQWYQNSTEFYLIGYNQYIQYTNINYLVLKWLLRIFSTIDEAKKHVTVYFSTFKEIESSKFDFSWKRLIKD